MHVTSDVLPTATSFHDCNMHIMTYSMGVLGVCLAHVFKMEHFTTALLTVPCN